MKFIAKLVAALLLLVIALLAVFRLQAWWRERPETPPGSTRYVETRFGKVAVQLSGPADGPQVMLIHGTAAWSGFWKDVSGHLASSGWRVIAVDTPPFGWSERDPQARYDRVSQASRLADIIAATGRKAIIVGHSFGGGAATETALQVPDRVAGLVLVDAAMGALDPSAKDGMVARSLSVQPVGEAVVSALVTNPMATTPVLRTFVHRKESAALWAQTLQAPMVREGSTAAYAQWLPNLFVAGDGAKSRSRDALAAITVPVAIIWGEADTVTPPQQGRDLSTLMKARSTLWLPDVGHIPHIEDPAGFLAALDKSLASVIGKE